MKEGVLAGTLCVFSRSELKEARCHVARWVGSESSTARRLPRRRRRRGRRPQRVAAGRRRLRHLAKRLEGHQVRAVIESMTGARFVHDTLEEFGWDVLVADAQKVKGRGLQERQDQLDRTRSKDAICRHGAAKESNLPSVGLPRPAGFEVCPIDLGLPPFAGSSVWSERVPRGHICRVGDTVRDMPRWSPFVGAPYRLTGFSARASFPQAGVARGR